jgi:hypothetical protein
MPASSEPLTWKVYVQDWVVAYTSDAIGVPGVQECERVFAERWEGRVEKGDSYIQARPADPSLIHLRLHQSQGEWVTEELAMEHARRITATVREWVPGPWLADLRLPGLPVIAGAGGPEEQAMLDYGKRKLRV